MRTTDTILLSNVTDIEHVDDWTTRLTYRNMNGHVRRTLVDNTSLSRLNKYGYVHISVWNTLRLDDLFTAYELTNRAVRQAKISSVEMYSNGDIYVRIGAIDARWRPMNGHLWSTQASFTTGSMW